MMHEIEYFNGIALLKGDGWITKWVKECARLDHDHTIHKRLGDILTNGMTIWDVGANVGTHTIFYQHCAGESGKVFAFEPYVAAAYCCQHNVPKAIVVPLGLSEHGGLCSLSVNHENPGMTTISEGGYPITTLSVRDAIRLYGRPDFIKLDCEGFEIDVLTGYFHAVHPDQYCQLYIEVNKATLEVKGRTVDELRKLLEAFRYTIRLFDNDTWSNPQIDILATPTN